MSRGRITHKPIRERAVERSTSSDADPSIADAIIHEETARRNLLVIWNRTGGSGALNSQHDIGWVQVGVDVTIAEIRSFLVAAEAQADAEARKSVMVGEIDKEQYQFRITPDVLNRTETNRTINVLRRARDLVYGKDSR